MEVQGKAKSVRISESSSYRMFELSIGKSRDGYENWFELANVCVIGVFLCK